VSEQSVKQQFGTALEGFRDGPCKPGAFALNANKGIRKLKRLNMKNGNLSERSPREVFEEHLRLAQEGEIEEDLKRNNAEDIVLLTNYGTFHGHEGIREAARLLDEQLPSGTYDYKLKLSSGKICFLHWTGDSEESYISDGADSYLIEEGKIKVQTIFYTVHKKKK